jgi:CubicO group peptidase (beta-lactamase class C family)
MRHLVTRTLLSILLGVGITTTTHASAPAHAKVTTDRALESATDRYLAPLIALDLFQGVVLVARGNQVVLTKGYGFANVELGVRNTPDHVFRIASLSKPFTEVALGTLIESGKLAPSDPLSKFLPEFPHGDRITIELLMNHRAGVPNLNSVPYDEESGRPNTLDSLVRAIAQHPLDFEPGTRRRYSNGGYAVLARVIEQASGTSYSDYLERAVFAPLGLKHTHHETDPMLIVGRAYGYVPAPDRRHGLVPAPFQQMATKTGGGSLISTAGNLFQFLRAAHTDRVLRRATWQSLLPLSDSTLAFQGRCPGFNVYMQRNFATDISVIVLANNYAAGMVADVAASLDSLATGARVQPPAWRADLTMAAEEAREWVGRYRPPAGALPYGDGPYDVRWQNGELVVAQGGVPMDVLIPQGEGTFLLRNAWSRMSLAIGADGKPITTLQPLWFKTEPVALVREK